MGAEYKKRIADAILADKLAGKGAVLIEGPKWCGKTTTAEQIAASVLYMDEPEHFRQNLLRAETDPKSLLEGDKPRLLDEWQLAPKLWDTIRYTVDHERRLGLFILTGSAVPPETDEIHHSGTGRFSRLKMRTMSLWESGESNGDVSLSRLFEGSNTVIRGECNQKLEDISYLICRGGWPLATEMSGKIALAQAFDYLDAVINEDIYRLDHKKKNPTKVSRLMRSYARHQGGQVGVGTICADIGTNEDADLNEKTVAGYIDALKKIFVIEDMEAWNPNLRSKAAIRISDTRYYVDPSIATAALGVGPGDLMEDLETMGLLFETLAIRDLRIYADFLDGKVYHYRDKTGLECDAVIHLRNGSYGLIEIKLGGDTLIEEGCRTLNRLASKIDTDKMKSPAFRMVLTAKGGSAYVRPDGICIVPIGCLRE